MADIGEGFAHSLTEATDGGLVSDPDALREVWDAALAAPAWTGLALWLHADLKPAEKPVGTAAQAALRRLTATRP